MLLIACVNVAGLMLACAGAGARSREIGIRAALGASRRRIVGQLLGESLLLAALGGLVGTALGYAALRGLLSMVPDQIPRWVRFDLDLRFLVFTILVTGASAVLFGLWPALAAARVDVQSTLHESSARSSASASKRRGLSLLVVGEIGLAAVLRIGAGLLIQAFRHLQRLDPGFRPEGVLTYRVSLPSAAYAKPPQRIAYFRDLLERSRVLPGVQQAGAATAPLSAATGVTFSGWRTRRRSFPASRTRSSSSASSPPATSKPWV